MDAQYPMTNPSDLPFWRVTIHYETVGGGRGNLSLPAINDEPSALAFYDTVKTRPVLAAEYVDRPGATVTGVQLLRFQPTTLIEDVTPAEVTG